MTIIEGKHPYHEMCDCKRCRREAIRRADQRLDALASVEPPAPRRRRHKRHFDLDMALAADNYGDPDDVDRGF